MSRLPAGSASATPAERATLSPLKRDETVPAAPLNLSIEYTMTKISFLFLTTVACTGGKITAGETRVTTPSTDDGLPSDGDQPSGTDDDQDPGEGEEYPSEEEEEAELPEDEAPTDTERDTGEVTTAPEESEETGDITLDDYLTTYCSTFAVPCMGYPSVENCVDAMMTAHFTGCTVVDKDALAECDSWVATITCDETSWNPACDDFIDCD